MKKMAATARTLQRGTQKQQQRLIKSASKLSPSGLERIAVLTRCGLFVEDGEAGGGDELASASSKGRPTKQARDDVVDRLKTAMVKMSGRDDLAAELSASTGSSSAISSGGPNPVPSQPPGAGGSDQAVTRGHRLLPPGRRSSALVSQATSSLSLGIGVSESNVDGDLGGDVLEEATSSS